MRFAFALPLVVALLGATGCQGLTFHGKGTQPSSADATVTKLEANAPAGEKLPEIVALPPAQTPPPAPGYAAAPDSSATPKAPARPAASTVPAGAAADEEFTFTPPPRATKPRSAPTATKGTAGVKAAAASHAKTYTVQKGDTLQKISQKMYGTTKSWQKIFDANKTKLKKPDHVVVGMVLSIP